MGEPDHSIDVNKLKQQEIIKQKQSDVISEDFVREHMPIVESIASSVAARGSLPVGIDFNDLVSWGTEGLIKAYKNFNKEKGSKFSTYAYYRIRGEIFDQIRNEWQYRNPSSYNEYRKNIQERIAEVTEEALDDSGKVDPVKSAKKMHDIIFNSAMVCLISLDTIGEVESSNSSFSAKSEAEEQISILQNEIKNLPVEEQNIIEMFYIQDFKQKEIAEKLKCSRSKICRIHMNILQKLRRRLERRFEE